MKVFALVGKSGTGKSHQSMRVARENDISYIIDDGLLISDNKILAGKSAKKEATKIASVKRAIFSDPAHIEEVKNALNEHEAESLLIIGTSDKMVQTIAESLGVGPISKIINIEDVSTPEEIKTAYEIRNRQGKHVIPVPTFEVKKQFPGYFLDTLVSLSKKPGQTIMEEKTVMRPTYSYLGEYKISSKAIADICIYEAMCFPSIHKVLRVKNASTPDGALMIDLDVSMYYPCRVNKKAEQVAERVRAAIEDFTSISVAWVHVNVKSLQLSQEEQDA